MVRKMAQETFEKFFEKLEGENKENNFKQTEIGLIPEDWEVVRLGEVAYFEIGKRMKGGALKSGEVFSIGGEHITDEGNIKFEPLKFVSKDFYLRMKKGKIKIGDILICKDGAKTGKTALVKYLPYQYCAVNEHVFIVRSKNTNQLINQFLFFFIYSRYGQTQIRDAFHGLIGGITQRELFNLLIPLPPLSEQRKIVRVLDKIQQAIDLQDRIIEQAKRLKKSLMQKLLTEGLYGEEQKETEIGLIPKSWKVVRLGDDEILKETQYGLSARGKKEGKYPILRMNNLVEGLISIDDLQFVDLDKKTFRKFKLEKGDILFNRTNSFELVGKTSIFCLNGDFVFASYLIRLKLNSEVINPFFLNFYFNWDITKVRLRGLASRGVSQANISATKLKSFLIPLPPLEEQKQIAHILSTVDKKIEVEQKRKQVLKALFKTMLHKLMSGEIRLKEVEI